MKIAGKTALDTASRGFSMRIAMLERVGFSARVQDAPSHSPQLFPSFPLDKVECRFPVNIALKQAVWLL